MLYEGVYQNLAFCSRMAPNYSEIAPQIYLKRVAGRRGRAPKHDAEKKSVHPPLKVPPEVAKKSIKSQTNISACIVYTPKKTTNSGTQKPQSGWHDRMPLTSGWMAKCPTTGISHGHGLTTNTSNGGLRLTVLIEQHLRENNRDYIQIQWAFNFVFTKVK